MALTRREMLRVSAATSLAFGGLGSASHAGESAVPAGRKRQLRIAHLTDMHVQPELEAARGLEACFTHVQTLAERGHDPADLIINGGDTIMDAMETERDRAEAQWAVWRSVRKDHCNLDVKSIIGNHDIWGLTKKKSDTTDNEARDGKQWACDEIGLATPWESFDRAGWHIVLLDSTFPFRDSYIAKLDDAQWDWLEKDLDQTAPSTPVLLVSHIPILSVHPVATSKPVFGPDVRPHIRVSGGMVHTDFDRFEKLFAKHKNVKACISGHLHIVEQIDYGGVRFLCDGAVSAGWWRGPLRGTDFGYSLVDLYDDGTVEGRYVAYGWQARG